MTLALSAARMLCECWEVAAMPGVLLTFLTSEKGKTLALI